MVRIFFDIEYLRNDTRYIVTVEDQKSRMHSIKWWHFQWPSVTSSFRRLISLNASRGLSAIAEFLDAYQIRLQHAASNAHELDGRGQAVSACIFSDLWHAHIHVVVPTFPSLFQQMKKPSSSTRTVHPNSYTPTSCIHSQTQKMDYFNSAHTHIHTRSAAQWHTLHVLLTMYRRSVIFELSTTFWSWHQGCTYE